MAKKGPQAKDLEALEMNLSPAEAVGRGNATVEMPVRRTKCCAGSRQVFLDSEADHRPPKNLGVAVTEAGRPRFGARASTNYAITAVYNGDGNFSGSTSAAVNETVNPRPTMRTWSGRGGDNL